MATTLQEISDLLTRAGIKNLIDDDNSWGIPIIKLGPVKTSNFADASGDKTIFPYIKLVDRSFMGQFFTMGSAFPAFDTKGSQHVEAFLKLCLMMQMNEDPVQFIYSEDGTVACWIEIPLADNTITLAQLKVCHLLLTAALDTRYPALKKALETGVVDALQPAEPQAESTDWL
jgi:hypothetical protein